MILNPLNKLFLKRLSFKRPAFLIFICIWVFTGCSSTKTLESIEDQEIQYSLISVIHADANYLFHENGVSKKADKVALKKLIALAEKAEHGEVFIFHQKPERRAFLFFPKKDRVYYHYKNGILVNSGKYSPTDGGFTKESELYKALSQNPTSQKTYFAYFGHEIPTFTNRAYHRSSPEMEFSTEIFSNHLQSFSSDIALTILSTCNNGSPLMMERLKDVTQTVIASPQNLHLSYLSLDKFELLESKPQISTHILADSIAQDSFSKLSSFLQTMVTVAVYSLDETRDYTTALSLKYEQHLKSVKAKPLFTNNADCKNIELLDSVMDTTGVNIYFKPASFGRKAGDSTHSGWGCKD